MQLEYSGKCINKKRNLEDKSFVVIIGSSVLMIGTKACPKTTFGSDIFSLEGKKVQGFSKCLGNTGIFEH